MNFQENVWEVCRRIPKGKVSTYKEIAHALGTKAYRAVGTALNNNPHSPVVPCHRVVNSDRRVGGFAHGTRMKVALLKKEGIMIKRGLIEDFENVFLRL